MELKFSSFVFSETTKRQIDMIEDASLRLKFYEAVTNYGIFGIEPEFSGLEKVIWVPMKDLIDSSQARRMASAANGRLGGRPKKNRDIPPQKTETYDVKNDVIEEKGVVQGSKDCSTNLQTENTECNISGLGKIQKELFDMVTEHNKTVSVEKKIPVSNTLISFVQKESRMLLEKLKGEPPEKIRAAFSNFLTVAKSDTWRTSLTWNSFLKGYNEFTPEYFSIQKYLKKGADCDEPGKRPQDLFYYSMRGVEGFDSTVFHRYWEDWLQTRPTGDAYFKWQAKKKEEMNAAGKA